MPPAARLLLFALAFLCALPAVGAAPGFLHIHADRPGPTISPMLYGIFFEEINMAGDGGLYAELVRNRSLEDAETPDHWTLLPGGGAVTVDSSQPINATNLRSLKLTAPDPVSGRVAVANEGYWGIALEKGHRYDLSLDLRAGDGFTGLLDVTLESAEGQRYAHATISDLTGDWKRHTLTLTASATDPKARLVFAMTRPGALWLDNVSLFPQKTFKGRENGLRPDLAEKLAALKPAFVRFPGGCWVEGDQLKFATRWKRTIGPLSERWNQWNIWQYFSTNGLGYHEYLQLCEDLGAEPLFVVNCGMSHKENVPMAEMEEWVQDALDAVEYANGPATSHWGAMRAKAGHPKPFHLKYVEIGNENGGPAYNERYRLFYDALKAKDPEMHLIANVTPADHPLEILDEHYYSAPRFFMANAHRYDTYKRSGPKIYVGEYAVTEGSGAGNLMAALGEAAFMTGMERNSDVVIMSSYAPLFANINYKKWNPDLINFDGTRSFGTPSYHVQRLFSANRGDEVVPVDVAPQVVDAQPVAVPRGAVGVGTWATQAEFKDVRVTHGDEVLYPKAGDAAPAWKTRNGKWEIGDGVIRQTSDAVDCRAVMGDPTWTDYTFSVKARKLGGAEGFLVMAHVEDENRWLWWNVGGWGNARSAIERSDGSQKMAIGNDSPGSIETGRWYDLRMEVNGRHVRCYLDGQLVNEGEDSASAIQPLYATASRDKATGDLIVKVVNTSETAQRLTVNIDGVSRLGQSAQATVLTGGPDDENSLEAPDKVAPRVEPFTAPGPTFERDFPAYSLTLLRLKTR